MARTKNKRTPSVSQVKTAIAKQITALRAHESTVQQQLNEIQTLIASVSGQAPSGTSKKRRGRKPGSKNKVATTPTAKGPKKSGVSLSDAIQKAMRKGKNYSVSDIKEGIAKVGYTSSAKNFSVMINQTLGRLIKSNVISRVERGVYVRGNTAPAKQEVVTAGSDEISEWKS